MKKPLPIRTVLSLLIPLFTTIIIISCDSLESDGLDNQPVVEFKQAPIVVAPQSSGVIDLNALVVSSSDKFRFSVTAPPKQGRLESINDYLLRYTPNAEVNAGRDGFVVSIFGRDNVVLEQDTVIIIITPPDSTTVYPCGVYAWDDHVPNLYADSVAIINVLANDTACGVDPSLLQVSIVEGDTAVGPAHGTVEVLADGKIKYTPGPTFQLSDKFLYRIVKPDGIPNVGSPLETSIATVYITGLVSECTTLPSAMPDTFEIAFDSVVVKNDSSFMDTTYHYGPYYIPVTDNDFWCGPDSVTIEVVGTPEGTVEPYDRRGFLYTLPHPIYYLYEYRFKYKLCTSVGCDTAEVVVKVR